MRRTFLGSALRAGLIGGILVCYFALVGMIETLGTLAIVGSKLTLNWVLIVGPPALAGFLAMRSKVIAGERVRPDPLTAIEGGVLAGVTTGALVAAALGLANLIGIDRTRNIFVSVSPTLVSVLAFHRSTVVGVAILVSLLALAGLAGASIRSADPHISRPIVSGLAAAFLMGLLQRVVPPAFDQLGIQRNWLYSTSNLGLTILGSVVVFVVAAAFTVGRLGHRLRELLRPSAVPTDGDPEHPLERGMGSRRAAQIVAWLVLGAILVGLPYIVGPVIARILGIVGIALLLGLGLNIVVGFAGLLDLGYVAFYSVGAYFTAILTGAQRITFKGFQPPAFGAHLSFYAALPIVVVSAAFIGLLIGAPVLRLRGDYLAIVTLGFGEIARVVFGSEWASPLFGGSEGMSALTKAPIGSFEFQSDPRHFYLLVLAFCLMAIYVSWRLQDSRIGRAWNAMREDEQVAGAMGVSTIRYKLLAFAMGGAIGSIGGALFAVSIGSLQIASFQIFVSITALSLIILGGIGSIPGVVVGAIVLVGLPGVLSELQQFQLLIYGAVLVAIMLLRPQGLVPNVRRSRELQEEERAQDQWAKALLEQREEATAGAEGAAS